MTITENIAPQTRAGGKHLWSKSSVLLALALLLFTSTTACNRGAQKPAPQPTPATPLERGLLEARRQSLALFFYAISRPDGGAISADDRQFLRPNITIERVATVITDDERYVIVGMNFEFPAEELAKVQQRFKVEEYR